MEHNKMEKSNTKPRLEKSDETSSSNSKPRSEKIEIEKVPRWDNREIEPDDDEIGV